MQLIYNASTQGACSLYEARWGEGDMLQGGCLEAGRAPLQIVCVAISLLQIPVDGTQLEVIGPI